MLIAATGMATGAQILLILSATAPGDLPGLASEAGQPDSLSLPEPIALAPGVMPFSGECFDQVVGRHLSRSVVRLDLLLSEVARVLKPGGRLLLSDYLAPEWRKSGPNKAARWLNAFFGLRESAPTGFISRSEWHALLYQSGFQLDDESDDREAIDFGEWAARPGLSQGDAVRLRAMLVQAPEAVRAFLTVESGADRITFSMVAAHFRARKRDSHAP